MLLLFQYQKIRKKINRKGFSCPRQSKYTVAEQIRIFNSYENCQYIMVNSTVQIICLRRLRRLFWEGCCSHWWILAAWKRQVSASFTTFLYLCVKYCNNCPFVSPILNLYVLLFWGKNPNWLMWPSWWKETSEPFARAERREQMQGQEGWCWNLENIGRTWCRKPTLTYLPEGAVSGFLQLKVG